MQDYCAVLHGLQFLLISWIKQEFLLWMGLEMPWKMFCSAQNLQPRLSTMSIAGVISGAGHEESLQRPRCRTILLWLELVKPELGVKQSLLRSMELASDSKQKLVQEKVTPWAWVFALLADPSPKMLMLQIHSRTLSTCHLSDKHCVPFCHVLQASDLQPWERSESGSGVKGKAECSLAFPWRHQLCKADIHLGPSYRWETQRWLQLWRQTCDQFISGGSYSVSKSPFV